MSRSSSEYMTEASSSDFDGDSSSFDASTTRTSAYTATDATMTVESASSSGTTTATSREKKSSKGNRFGKSSKKGTYASSKGGKNGKKSNTERSDATATYATSKGGKSGKKSKSEQRDATGTSYTYTATNLSSGSSQASSSEESATEYTSATGPTTTATSTDWRSTSGYTKGNKGGYTKGKKGGYTKGKKGKNDTVRGAVAGDVSSGGEIVTDDDTDSPSGTVGNTTRTSGYTGTTRSSDYTGSTEASTEYGLTTTRTSEYTGATETSGRSTGDMASSSEYTGAAGTTTRYGSRKTATSGPDGTTTRYGSGTTVASRLTGTTTRYGSRLTATSGPTGTTTRYGGGTTATSTTNRYGSRTTATSRHSGTSASKARRSEMTASVAQRTSRMSASMRKSTASFGDPPPETQIRSVAGSTATRDSVSSKTPRKSRLGDSSSDDNDRREASSSDRSSLSRNQVPSRKSLKRPSSNAGKPYRIRVDPSNHKYYADGRKRTFDSDGNLLSSDSDTGYAQLKHPYPAMDRVGPIKVGERPFGDTRRVPVMRRGSDVNSGSGLSVVFPYKPFNPYPYPMALKPNADERARRKRLRETEGMQWANADPFPESPGGVEGEYLAVNLPQSAAHCLPKTNLSDSDFAEHPMLKVYGNDDAYGAWVEGKQIPQHGGIEHAPAGSEHTPAESIRRRRRSKRGRGGLTQESVLSRHGILKQPGQDAQCKHVSDTPLPLPLPDWEICASPRSRLTGIEQEPLRHSSVPSTSELPLAPSELHASSEPLVHGFPVMESSRFPTDGSSAWMPACINDMEPCVSGYPIQPSFPSQGLSQNHVQSQGQSQGQAQGQGQGQGQLPIAPLPPHTTPADPIYQAGRQSDFPRPSAAFSEHASMTGKGFPSNGHMRPPHSANADIPTERRAQSLGNQGVQGGCDGVVAYDERRLVDAKTQTPRGACAHTCATLGPGNVVPASIIETRAAWPSCAHWSFGRAPHIVMQCPFGMNGRQMAPALHVHCMSGRRVASLKHRRSPKRELYSECERLGAPYCDDDDYGDVSDEMECDSMSPTPRAILGTRRGRYPTRVQPEPGSDYDARYDKASCNSARQLRKKPMSHGHTTQGVRRMLRPHFENPSGRRRASWKVTATGLTEKEAALASVWANPDVTWENIFGYDDVKRALRTYFVTKRRLPAQAGPSKCALLFGPPGCGKTLIAQALAGDVAPRLYAISFAKFHRVDEARDVLGTLFSLARKTPPCILFFDDMETVFEVDAPNWAAADAVAIRQEFFRGIAQVTTKDVMVLCATNAPFNLTPQLHQLTPMRIYVPLPDEDTRYDVLRYLSHRSSCAVEEVVLDQAARETQGYSSRELAGVIDCAVDVAMMRETNQDICCLRTQHFTEAMEMSQPAISADIARMFDEWASDAAPWVRGRHEQEVCPSRPRHTSPIYASRRAPISDSLPTKQTSRRRKPDVYAETSVPSELNYRPESWYGDAPEATARSRRLTTHW